MSIAKYRNKLLNVEKQKSRIISELLGVEMMLRGSFVRIHTKCGKDNCWCKDKKGHPHTRITWSEKGRTITRKVPRQHEDWIQEMIHNYHRFRSLHRKLIDLETETKQLLDDLENVLIDTTRRGKDSLATNKQNRSKTSALASKKHNRRKTASS